MCINYRSHEIVIQIVPLQCKLPLLKYKEARGTHPALQ